MIGRIIYGESCQGTLNYVFSKEGMRILGYGNMYSQDISQKFFGNVLHFQGQRNATKNRYAHISLNLPPGEHLDDATFNKVSKEYMDKIFKELYRTLKPGGCLLVSVKAGEGEGFIDELLGIRTESYFALFSEDEITGYYKKAGFSLEFLERRNPYDFEIDNERIFAMGKKQAGAR